MFYSSHCVNRRSGMASIRQVINELHSKGDWKTALDIQNKSEDEYNTVLWIRPALEDLMFINNAVTSRSLNVLVSIGCGSGFLEWLIQSATGLRVLGVEVDRNWWTSPYIRVYIPLIYQEDKQCVEILQDVDAAVMFCYFNNGQAFKDYLNKFKGPCLIIVGPKCNRHTNPHPFHPVFEQGEWTLRDYKQIQDTNDYIVVYDRRLETVGSSSY